MPAHELEGRRLAFVDRPWSMADQRHGTTVVRVDAPGAGDRSVGDVLFTDRADVVLGVWAADCAPLVLAGRGTEFAVVHAGWRGLAAGVVDAAVAEFSEPIVAAWLGPTIGACCYEFGHGDLSAVAAGTHAAPADIRSSTTAGRHALDVTAAVRHAVAAHGLTLEVLGGCPGCSYDGFSHRVRRDAGRHVVAAWREHTS